MSALSSTIAMGTGYPCENHKSRKRGVCPACKSCKLCAPPEYCHDSSMHHIPQKRGRKKRKVNSPLQLCAETTMASTPVGKLLPVLTTPASKYSQPGLPITPQSLFQPSITHQNRIAQFCKILNVDFEGSYIPMEGFNPSVIRNPSRSQQRAKKAATIISQAVATLLCPEEPALYLQFLKGNQALSSSTARELKRKSSQGALETSVLEYSLNSHGSICDVAQSLLAGCYDRASCNEMLIEAAQQKCGLTEQQIELCETKDENEGEGDLQLALDVPAIGDYQRLRNSKAKMGKMKFASLRNAYSQIKDDNPFPAASYRCRLSPVKLQKAMTFIQSNLDIRPGRVRNVRMGSAVFENIPIYERGGLSLKRIHEKYSLLVDADLRVGINTFYAIVKLLTKKGGEDNSAIAKLR